MSARKIPKVTVEKEHDENEFSGFIPQGFQVTPLKSSCMRFRANISGQKLCPDRESNEDLQKSTKLRTGGLNVSNIRVTNLEDRLPDEDESPTVCFSYGQESSSLQKQDLKKT